MITFLHQGPLQSVSTTSQDSPEKEKIAKVLLLGAAESGKSTLSRQIRTLHGNDFSDEELMHYKHNIREACVDLLAKYLDEYLSDSSHVTSSDEQREKYSKFLRLASNPDFRDMDSRKFLDLSIDVWRSSPLQNYIFQKFANKVLQPAGKNSAGSSANFAESGKEEVGTTQDENLLHNSSQTHSSVMPRHEDVHGNIPGAPVSDVGHTEEAEEACEPTGATQQFIYSDNPAFHFLPSFSRIMAEGYCPTVLDILSLRVATTGMIISLICDIISEPHLLFLRLTLHFLMNVQLVYIFRNR